MHICVIAGSHRVDSQSSKVGKYIARQIVALGATAELVDLRNNPLPLWSEEMWGENTGLQKQWAPWGEKLAAADGFVVIAPEWAGMAPAGLKNFFLYAGNTALAHKPAYLVGISASRGGAYPIAELRMSSYKNSYLCYIPEQLIVRDVQQMLNDDEVQPESKEDGYIKARAQYGLKLLLKYAEGLKVVRESGIIDPQRYPFGM